MFNFDSRCLCLPETQKLEFEIEYFTQRRNMVRDNMNNHLCFCNPLLFKNAMPELGFQNFSQCCNSKVPNNYL